MALDGINSIFVKDWRFGVLLMRDENIFVLVWHQILVREDKRDTQPKACKRVCQTLVLQSLLRNACTQITCVMLVTLELREDSAVIRTACTNAS